jgi:GNAT superfamily N-acetyltransferase
MPGFLNQSTIQTMTIYEAHQDGFVISTDKSKLNKALIHDYLSHHSYWAQRIPLETVERSIEYSFCFGVYEGTEQVGFARVVTDHATFAYLADVFILAAYRGRGLSKWLMGVITANPQLRGLRRWLLATRDAHGLYAQFGFGPCDKPQNIMQRRDVEAY